MLHGLLAGWFCLVLVGSDGLDFGGWICFVMFLDLPVG